MMTRKKKQGGFLYRTASDLERHRAIQTRTRRRCYDEGLAIDLRYDAGFYASPGQTHPTAMDLFSTPFVGGAGLAAERDWRIEAYSARMFGDDAEAVAEMAPEDAPVYGTGELEAALEPTATAAGRAPAWPRAMEDESDAEVDSPVFGTAELEEDDATEADERDDGGGFVRANVWRSQRDRTLTADAGDADVDARAPVYGAGELEPAGGELPSPVTDPIPIGGGTSDAGGGAPAQATNAFGWSVGSSDDPDTRAFESDLKAILAGQKTHPSTVTPGQLAQPRDDEDDDTPSAPTEQNMRPHASSFTHNDFDRWGMSTGMSNPTTYNMGRFSLSKQFEAFDREMDASARNAQRKQRDHASAQSFGLTTDELEADVDAIVAPATVAPTAVARATQATPATPSMPVRAMDALNLRFDVPLVPQQTGYSCWAAGCAMLVGWRDQMSINPEEIARATGHWAQYHSGLLPEDTSVFPVWGMTHEYPQCYTAQGLYELLDRYGPLWVASAEPGPHIRVVTGMVGDGSPDGTTLYINDPWEQGMTRFRLPNAGAAYTETYTTFMRKQDELAMREIKIPGAVYVAHLSQLRVNPLGLRN